MLNKTYQGLKGLLSGMALTIGYFLKPSKVITQQYPENRETLKLPQRTRSRVELVRDPEKGGYICAACGVCVKACPNGSLQVIRGKDPVTKKPVLEKFVYHFERCTVCGLCVDSCHSEALTMGQQFESAVYDSSQLTMILNEDAMPKHVKEEGAPGEPAGKAEAAAGNAAPAKPESSQPAASGPAETPKPNP